MIRISCLIAASLFAAGCAERNDYPIVGTLERDRIALAAELREPLTSLHVHEGDRVASGVLLVELDDRRARAEYDRLAAQRERMQRRLDELMRGPRHEEILETRAQLAAADSRLNTARLEFARVERLRAERVASERDLDLARGERDRLAYERDAARAALEALLSGTTIEELDQARAALAEAKAALAQQQETLVRLAVRAPRDAVVEALPFRPGETPQGGAAIVVLRAIDKPPYARVYVPAALRERALPGNSMWVRIGDAEYAGRVRFISSEAAFTPYFALTEHDAGRLSYLAEIDLDGAEHLPSGIPARARPGD